MSSTVKSIAYVHTADIDPTVVKSGATWEGLARFIEAQSDVQELSRLLKLATVWNVSEAERLTIEYDELETAPTAGFVREPIRNFLTPGGVIKELPPGPKRAMLERLYIEYQEIGR